MPPKTRSQAKAESSTPLPESPLRAEPVTTHKKRQSRKKLGPTAQDTPTKPKPGLKVLKSRPEEAATENTDATITTMAAPEDTSHKVDKAGKGRAVVEEGTDGHAVDYNSNPQPVAVTVKHNQVRRANRTNPTRLTSAKPSTSASVDKVPDTSVTVDQIYNDSKAVSATTVVPFLKDQSIAGPNSAQSSSTNNQIPDNVSSSSHSDSEMSTSRSEIIVPILSNPAQSTSTDKPKAANAAPVSHADSEKSTLRSEIVVPVLSKSEAETTTAGGPAEETAADDESAEESVSSNPSVLVTRLPPYVPSPELPPIVYNTRNGSYTDADPNSKKMCDDIIAGKLKNIDGWLVRCDPETGRPIVSSTCTTDVHLTDTHSARCSPSRVPSAETRTQKTEDEFHGRRKILREFSRVPAREMQNRAGT